MTTIQSQVDLIAQYRATLAKKEGAKRGALLAEAATKLGGEGDAFVLERLAAADEPDESRAKVVEQSCYRAMDEGAKKAGTLITAAISHPGALTAKATLECELSPDPAITAASSALTERLCTVKSGLEARGLQPHGGAPDKTQVRSAGVKAGLTKCTKGGSVLARLVLYETVSTAEWLDGLTQPEANVILEVTHSAEREKIFAALEKRVRTRDVLKLAKTARFELTEKEANLLLDLAFEPPKDWDARASVATALVNSRTLLPAARAPPQEGLEGRRAHGPGVPRDAGRPGASKSARRRAAAQRRVGLLDERHRRRERAGHRRPHRDRLRAGKAARAGKKAAACD
jgi:hypothetical protein